MDNKQESKPEKEEILYKIGEAVDLTGLSEDQIRDYTDDFNIQIHRTKGGHRRFSKDNVETLLTIKKKLTEEMWSYEQTRRWFNGESDPVLSDKNFQTNLEKKIDELLESNKRDEDFQKVLIQKLDEQAQHYEGLIQSIKDHHKKELENQQTFFENKLLENNNDVVNRLNKMRLEAPKKEEDQRPENLSFLSKIFGKNKKKHG